MDQLNGGPAYPVPEMTLRDWFAGQEKIDPSEELGWEIYEALAGPRPAVTYCLNPLAWFRWWNTVHAELRYARADAMLAARSSKPEPEGT